MTSRPNDETELLQIMAIRNPRKLIEGASRVDYIFDDVIDANERKRRDLFGWNSRCEIGRLVHDHVFCSPEPDKTSSPTHVGGSSDATRTSDKKPNLRKLNQQLVNAVLATLPRLRPQCGKNGTTASLLDVVALDRRRFVETHDGYLVFTDRLEDIVAPLIPKLREFIALAGQVGSPLDTTGFLRASESLFGVHRLWRAVFAADETQTNIIYRQEYLATRCKLFDALYLLYVVKRKAPVDLEDVINGLRALHLLEAPAADRLADAAVAREDLGPEDGPVYNKLPILFPLVGRNAKDQPATFRYVNTKDDIARYLRADPVVHSLFSRLHFFRRPFNALRPAGVGDLKVVRQRPLGYQLGDIAYIENVMRSETRLRQRTESEKTEELATFSLDTSSETSHDRHTTDRFELKREVESALDRKLTAGGSTTFTYDSKTHVVWTTAGSIATEQSNRDVDKGTVSLVRETIEDARSKIMTRTAQSRTSSRRFETEEINKHEFANNGPQATHISGIYRWLNRAYEAQIYNFGKRLMFEFVVPEPAAFFAAARIGYAGIAMEVPQPPAPPTLVALPASVASLTPEAINEEKFLNLSKTYDLSQFTYPEPTRVVRAVDRETKLSILAGQCRPNDYDSRTFILDVDAQGYALKRLRLDGWIKFAGRLRSNVAVGPDNPKNPPDHFDVNTVELFLDGELIYRKIDNQFLGWYFKSLADVGGQSTPGEERPLGDATVNYPNPIYVGNERFVFDRREVTLSMDFWDAEEFRLAVTFETEISESFMRDWRLRVFNHIRALEQTKIDTINASRTQVYEAAVAAYKAQLARLQSAAIGDLLHGNSTEANRRLIRDELRKQCISIVSREFDSDAGDDILSGISAIESNDIASQYWKLTINEVEATKEIPAHTTAVIEQRRATIKVPTIDLAKAEIKGRYVQFLEQAFEWEHLSYVFYPYYWADKSKWLDLFNRTDQADPLFSEFLQAGSARVLVAVRPGFDMATIHFIATGEPWEGGPIPAIGDPLYLPLHQEVRAQQDDLAGGSPVGEAWTFTLPTNLTYLVGSNTPLPTA